MIDFYTWRTPNGQKVAIALEEMGLPYRAHAINIGTGAQFDRAFLAISPNNKIPAIVDHEGPDGQALSLFESGAILIYLAEKSGTLLPSQPSLRYGVLQWLMWQMGGFGPMLGQAHYFLRFAKEVIPYAQDRYATEARRLYGVLEKQLQEHAYVAGDYSIADIAIYPWSLSYAWQGIDLTQYPAVAAWMERVGERPAVKRGLDLQLNG